jgi:hypothetical protein
MLAILLAAALAAAPRQDTITTQDGARLSGRVVEESPTRGVTIQMPDGTLRRFDPGVVVRIEFADGSISNWDPAAAPQQATPAPPPPAPPVQAQRAPAQAAPRTDPDGFDGPLDTVFLVSGGRVRGRVIEWLPSEGATVQVPDGTTRRYSPEQISRIEYADGSVTRRREPSRLPPPRRPPPPAAPPPGYAPPAYEPRRAFARDGTMAPIVPVYLTLGLGGAGFSGRLAGGPDPVRTGDWYEGQLQFGMEGGVRLNRAVSLGLYLDVGVGDPAPQVRLACAASGEECVATTGKFGLFLKHTWDATKPTSKWLSVGTGFAFANVTSDLEQEDGENELFRFSGREMFRLMGGLDVRSNPVFGVGFYGGVSWSTYDEYEDPIEGKYDISNATHSMIEAGVRLTLFP